MKRFASQFAILVFLIFSAAVCTAKQEAQPEQGQDQINAEEKRNSYTPAQIEAVSTRANVFFEKAFDDFLARNPMMAAYLGKKINYTSWGDISDENEVRENQLMLQTLQAFEKEFDPEALNAETKLSYELFKDAIKLGDEGMRFQKHNYPLNQMYGLHTQVPTFLMNIHRIDEEKDALAFIGRINNIPALFDQAIKLINDRADFGVIPPKFVFPYVTGALQNFLKGKPFDESQEENSLLTVFTTKLAKLKLDEKRQAELITLAKTAMRESMLPAYTKLTAQLLDLEKRADTRDGAWKLPNGEEFYNYQLRLMTSTPLTAQEIHDIGLKEVARIHDEMRSIMKKVDFKGDLKAFFDFTRTDKQFYLPNTKEGKDKYLAMAVEYVDNMKKELPKMFKTLPKADIEVKAVEKFREKSAAMAFYEGPAPDGSRPGTFYANLADMQAMPTFTLEALAYHEGVPGHHMQIAISQELTNMPKFRKFGMIQSTAHVEGWGLYTELLPKEMGFYKDPYSDFGRLAMELRRAVRLVVDTGIHAKKWSREKAIDYFVDNSPNSRYDCTREIERYIVLPGQATAYKIGMLKILELRETAKTKLGEKFDIREFHDVLLTSGPITLKVLERLVNEWVASRL